MSSSFMAILVASIILASCSDSVPISDLLIGCYRGNATQPLFPNSLPLLIELIRKVEDSTANTKNARTLSAMLLHTLRIDGIEREPSMHESAFVTPYAADGIMIPKFLLLLKVVSNVRNDLDIRSALTRPEMCQLHRMLSATVDPWERGDENIVCSLHNRQADPADQPHYSIRPFDGTWYTQINNRRRLSRCPIEGGSVHSVDYGTFAAGTIIASIAAGLQPQRVPISELHTIDWERTPWDARESTKSRTTAKGVRKLLRSLDVIDNGYAASLAGDLAEVCVYQGPHLNSSIKVGVGGHWNSTYLPRIRYLHHAHHFPHWEMTDSEILAGIDGIFLAQKVAIWMNDPVRLRLSQAIDMYYSDRGLPYLKIENSGTDSATVRESPKANTEASHTTDALATSTHSIQNGDDITNACSRPRILDSIDRKKLQDQTYAISQVLQYSTSSVAIADKVLRTNCNAVVDKFFRHSSNLLRAQPSCRGVYHTPLKVPVVDLTLITDGSRDRFATLELISFLAETIGISKFGSYLTVIDGKAGNRIVGRTQSIADVFQQLQFFTEHETYHLELSRSLATYLEMMSVQMRDERMNGTLAGPPHVLLIICQGQTITENDFSESRRMLRTAFTQFPDLFIVFVVNNEHLATDLLFESRTYGEQRNSQYFVIVEKSIEFERFKKPLLDTLMATSRRMFAPLCKEERSPYQMPKDYHVDYVSPGDEITFRVSQYYLMGTNDIRIQFDGSDHGIFTVCMDRDRKFNAADCQTTSGYGTVTFFLSEPCGAIDECRPIYFRVSVDKSLVKCLDNDCRYPDQIRFSIRQKGLRCDHSLAIRTALPAIPLVSFIAIAQWCWTYRKYI